MNLSDLVGLILRANKAGRPVVPDWQEDTTDADAKRFVDQLSRMLPEHAEEIRRVAFPPAVRVQFWCETFGCAVAKIVEVPRKHIGRPSPPCAART